MNKTDKAIKNYTRWAEIGAEEHPDPKDPDFYLDTDLLFEALTEAKAENEKLVKWIEKSDHLPNCDKKAYSNKHGKCTCKRDELLTE